MYILLVFPHIRINWSNKASCKRREEEKNWCCYYFLAIGMECYSSTQAALNITQESPCGAPFQVLMEDPSHNFPYKYLMPKTTHCSCQSWQQQQPLSVSNCLPVSSTVLPLHWETGNTRHLWKQGAMLGLLGVQVPLGHFSRPDFPHSSLHESTVEIWGMCTDCTGFYTKGCSWLWLQGCYLRNDTEASDDVMAATTHVYWETACCASTGGNSSKSPATFCFSGSVCSVLSIINFSHS